MIKFRIGFTIESETLFRLISKVVPDLQDLSIEEMIEPPISKNIVRFEDLIEKPKRKRKSKGTELNFGINKILMGILADKQEHKRFEFLQALKNTRYSSGSLNSRMQHLMEKKIVVRPRLGMYKLNEENTEKAS